MPLKFNTPLPASSNRDHFVKIHDRTLKQIPHGNQIFNFSANFSSNCTNYLPRSKVCCLHNDSTHSKPPIRILSAKIVGNKHFSKGKLFSKAKIVSDSKGETFLTPRSTQTERATSHETKLKTIRFLRVTPEVKKHTNKPASPKKTRSVGDEKVQNKVMEEYYIQPETENSVQNNKTYVSKNGKERFTIDYQDGQMIKNKNLFSSSSGQLLLENLIGSGTMKSKSNPGIKTLEKERNLKNSGINQYFAMPKVTSREVIEKNENTKLKAKNSLQTSFFKQIPTEKKPMQGVVSSFSRLIMRDKIAALRSDELDLSKTIDEESLNELSVMSKR